MKGIILQAIIDKKRKKCFIPIEQFDAMHPMDNLIQPSIQRISQ